MRRRTRSAIGSVGTLLLATALLAGCSDDGDDEGPDGDAAAPPAVEVAGAGTGDDPLRIGVVVSVSSAPGEGQDWLDGAQGARVAEYRLDGGGGDVELEVVDDSGTPNGAIVAVEQLAQSGVAGIVMATSGPHLEGALASPVVADIPVLLPYDRTADDLPANVLRTTATQDDIDAALLAALGRQGLDRPFVLTADGLAADGVGSADALAYTGRNVEKLARRIVASRADGTIDSVVIAASAATQAEITSALRGELEDLPVLLTPEAQTRTFSTGLAQDAGTVASRFASAGLDASDTTTLSSSPAADAVAAYFAALRLAAGDPEVTDLFDDVPFGEVATDADTASHDAVMAIAAAAASAGSVEPGDVLGAFDGLTVTSAEGLAGPSLDFSGSDAVAAGDVVPLIATVQDPGVRPSNGESGARLLWFALDPGSS